MRLTEKECQVCEDTVARLKGSSQQARCARLLLADAYGPGWTDRRAADAFDCPVRTVENLGRRCVLESFEWALHGHQRGPNVPRQLLDGQQDTQLIALRWGPPEGLRPRVAAAAGPASGGAADYPLDQPHDGGHHAIQNGVLGRRLQDWRLPALRNGNFAAGRENVLAAYARHCDAERPVIGRDEQPVQLVRETRERLPATEEFPERVDCKHERAGMAALLLCGEPLAGWRAAIAREQRTQPAWAEEVAALLEGRDADCERVTLVLDNLNPNRPGAFYEACEPQRARALAERIECCSTPQHGSWLNLAEVELRALSQQCLGQRRIGDLKTLQNEIAAGGTDTDQRRRGVDWHMTIDDARSKLKSVYSKIVT